MCGGEGPLRQDWKLLGGKGLTDHHGEVIGFSTACLFLYFLSPLSNDVALDPAMEIDHYSGQ